MGDTNMTILTTTTTPAPVRAKRNLRGLARGLGIAAALIAGLALAGAGYEAIAARGDARMYPRPGRLVDVGGYRLHIQCIGTGSPTVVLDAGLGGMSLDWSLVQTEMAATAQVCSYDRAGLGWSDSGPLPRSPERIAHELHTLLTNAGIDGPYVLVGHSLAGKNVRLFAAMYPDQVAGIVLVDARSEYVDARTSSAEAQSFQQRMATQNSVYGAARALGLIRLFGAGLFSPPAMPSQARTAMALFGTDRQALETISAEALERATDDAQLQSAPSLGDRPLMVLAAEENMTATPNWAEAQLRLAGLSTQGHLIVAAGSGHYVHWDQPALVIDAVRQVVEQVRGE
jgi:pimeloyl-ACP methyl ester carboxylesterase